MRNYNSKPPTKGNKAELLHCPIFDCNKKYKTNAKLQQHIEQHHYYETRNGNSFTFDNHIRAQIYESAASYIVELDKIRNDPHYGETLAKNLLPQLNGKEPTLDELVRIVMAQASFARKLFESNLVLCDWSAVMDDLERFFNLGLPYYDTNFCPTLAIDFLWHCMMQRPSLYAKICIKLYNEIMPHCNQFRSAAEDAKRYEYFWDPFKHRFNRDPYSFPAALEAYSIDKVREVFIILCDNELKNIADRKEMKKQLKERGRNAKEKREATLLEICENVGKSREKMGDWEGSYYIRGYELGYREKNLVDHVNRELETAKNCFGSTC